MHIPYAQPIFGLNLSHAWANALLKCYDSPGGILSPAVVYFPAFSHNGLLEIAEVRAILDSQLADPSKFIDNQSVIETIAGTIFPEAVWRNCRGDRQAFYKIYKDMLPFIRHKQSNRRGVYFQRMIAYPSDTAKEPINQLEHIITTWLSGNHRHSALQAGIFDPRSDHSNAPLQGFPCLQQVAFHANGSNGKDGLSVVAFYANQTVQEKAYGNYIGLYRLGLFMAGEMGLQLKDIVCIASVLKLNNSRGKAKCESLVKAIREIVKNERE